MIKFVHRKHYNKKDFPHKIVIYYSFSEIVLGIMQIVLVVFFIYNYWQSQTQLNVPMTGSYLHTP